MGRLFCIFLLKCGENAIFRFVFVGRLFCIFLLKCGENAIFRFGFVGRLFLYNKKDLTAFRWEQYYHIKLNIKIMIYIENKNILTHQLEQNVQEH